jgi:hypothetical protein
MAIKIRNSIDWKLFLGRHDLLWDQPARAWHEGAYTGNGEIGATVYTDPGRNVLIWHLGKVDLQDHRSREGSRDGLPPADVLNTASWSSFHWTDPRLDLGCLELSPVGEIRDGSMRMDLWNAEITGSIETDRGGIRFRSFTHAQEMVELIEIGTEGDEDDATICWRPACADSPRHQVQDFLREHFGMEPLIGYQSNPAPVQGLKDGIHYSVQSLLAGSDYTTAYKEHRISRHTRRLYCSTFNAEPNTGSRDHAIAAVKAAANSDYAVFKQSHRDWWHGFYPQSFLSIPDTRLESFYWIQIYRLGSATRAERALIDNTGPWYKVNGWAYATWDMNVQLCYWPVYAGNRLHLGESLLRFNQRVVDQYIEAVPEEWRHDSAGNPGVSNQRRIGGEFAILGCLPWTLHNVWLHYRYSMEDRILEKDLFPLLRRSMNYYIHLMTTDAEGRFHLPEALSPEYPQRTSDTNFDLALLRWGCQTLLWIDEYKQLHDPLASRWREILEKLTPPPQDETGLMIGCDVSYTRSHRHHQHLMAFYPLSLINWDQYDNRKLIERSVRHWLSLDDELEGFSYSGAASMFAFMRKPDEAIQWLHRLLDEKIHPNTSYTEWEDALNPVVETPISVTVPIHEMMIQSWGNRIRVFPSVPTAWCNTVFHQLRAEGAFLVSGERRDGETCWIVIKSEAGQPCRVECDIPSPQIFGSREFEFTGNGDGTWSIDLRAGEEVMLFPAGEQPNIDLHPVAAFPGASNYYGVHEPRGVIPEQGT